MICVVGSGPAGVACAAALLARGRAVTLLDAGVRLEEDRAEVVRRLARTEHRDWNPDEIDALCGGSAPRLGRVSLKLAFGSDYAYREVQRLTPFVNEGSATQPTMARGGFSAVWGAAVMPYRSKEIADWPITIESLAPHYEAVGSMIRLAGRTDDLAELYPLYVRRQRPMPTSRQAAALLRDMQARREELGRSGYRFGVSRLAALARDDSDATGCSTCGRCLTGCPYGYIYDAAHTLDELRRNPRFTYRPGVAVDRVKERDRQVTISGRTIETAERLRVDASRVLLACGVLQTTRILLASMEAYDRELPLSDSQYFLLPWLRHRSAGRADREALHTLAQIFIELDDEAVSERNVHLQVYSYSEVLRRTVEEKAGPLARLVRPLARPLVDRLLIIQGYLHSGESPGMRVRLARASEDGAERLTIRANPDRRCDEIIRRLISSLRRHRRAFRATPLAPLLRITPPGRGFHSGGTFPMRTEPSSFESDLQGRPFGFRRVHAVDSTILPSIPATTITFSVMANAHRIGSAIEEA